MSEKFKSYFKSNTPLIVEFYANWCEPCEVLNNILVDIKKDLKEQVNIIKINVDNNPNASSVFKIRQVPTLILFKSEKLKWRVTGEVSKELILDNLQAFIKN